MFVVLFEDSAAMAGLIVAFVGVLLTQITGILYFDGAASVIIGIILAGTAVWLAYETKSLLIGESANPHVIEWIRRIADGAFAACRPRATTSRRTWDTSPSRASTGPGSARSARTTTAPEER